MTRYHAGPVIWPEGLALAALTTLGAVATIMAVAPDLVRMLPKPPLIIIANPLPPEPLPKPEPVREQRKIQMPQRKTDIFSPDPVIKTATDTGPAIGTTTPPLDPPPFGIGTADSGAGPTRLPDPRPPVLVGPEIDQRFAGTFQPAYPAGKLREGVAGFVTVRVLIGTDGRVKAFEPVGSNDSDFLEATRRRAFSHWRFTPATRDGEPYEAWKTMKVRFTLNEE